MIYIDPSQVSAGSITAEDAEGAPFDVENAVIIPVVIDLDAWEEGAIPYDPDNQYSPSAADSRSVARTVLDALNGHLHTANED